MTFSAEDFAKALEEQSFDFQKGSTVRGVVYSHESEGAYVDIGGKSAAFLPLREAAVEQITAAEMKERLPLGETQEFMVIRDQNDEGQVVVSIRRMEIERVWKTLKDMADNDESITVKVTGTNKGGVTVDVKGLRGFIPRSHLVDSSDMESLIKAKITASFLEVDRDRNRVVLSQREAAKTETMRALEIGQLVEGTVVNIKPYGAFVEFGGTTGLLHVNQISRKRVESVANLLTVGQEISVVVVDVDELKGRISLSTRVLEKHPGEILENMQTVMDEAPERVKQMDSVLADRD